MIHAINEVGSLATKLPVRDTLFFKIQGTPESTSATGKVVQSIVKKHGSSRFVFAEEKQQADDLWNNRKVALFAAQAFIPGSRVWTTDVWYAIRDTRFLSHIPY
jgi:D-lactate dehydrogenase (cytochrome)